MDSTQPVTVKHFVAPLPDSVAHDVVVFLRYKGAPWVDDIRQRVRGALRGSEDHYLLAFDGDRLVGHAWYTVADSDRRLGLIGHIYTHPEMRRQGISRRLVELALSEFGEQGGCVMQLFTSTPYTVPLYEQLGFENLFQQVVYHEQDWYMRYPSGAAGQVQQWLAASDVRIRDLAPGDLPHYCLLYNVGRDVILKDRAQQIGFGLEAELAFINIRTAVSQRRAVCSVLDNSQTLVGAASVCAPVFPHQSHIGLFDVYTCSFAAPHAVRLARHCLEESRKLGITRVYAMQVDPAKSHVLEQLGFVSRATLRDHYRVGDQFLDCELLEWMEPGL